MEKKVVIYTDGACQNNPGIGGWGVILICEGNKKYISGFAEYTTNNKMELQAVIEALKSLKERSEIKLYTDSAYVKGGITRWIKSWKVNNWKNSERREIKNKEQWMELDYLSSLHNIEYYWVKGHAEDELNKEVDKLARNEILKYIKE
jgi:ribonuclease HI